MELPTKIKDTVKELNNLLEQAEKEGLKLNVSVKRDYGMFSQGFLLPMMPYAKSPQVVITITKEI